MRIASGFNSRRSTPGRDMIRKAFVAKSCVLCKTVGRSFNTHNLGECRFLPDSDKCTFGRFRLVAADDCDGSEAAPSDEYIAPERESDDHDLSARRVECPPSTHRVNVIQSPVLSTLYQHHPVALTLDTGATTNLIRALAAKTYNLPINPASQIARQADGVTPLDVIGEVHCDCQEGA